MLAQVVSLGLPVRAFTDRGISIEVKPFSTIVFLVKLGGFYSTVIHEDLVCKISTKFLRVVRDESELITYAQYKQEKIDKLEAEQRAAWLQIDTMFGKKP